MIWVVLMAREGEVQLPSAQIHPLLLDWLYTNFNHRRLKKERLKYVQPFKQNHNARRKQILKKRQITSPAEK